MSNLGLNNKPPLPWSPPEENGLEGGFIVYQGTRGGLLLIQCEGGPGGGYCLQDRVTGAAITPSLVPLTTKLFFYKRNLLRGYCIVNEIQMGRGGKCL